MKVLMGWMLLITMAATCFGGAAIAEVAPSGWDYVYADGWLYYATPFGDTGNNDRQLCRFRPEDGALELLAKGGSAFYQLCVMDGWVYTPMADEAGVLRARTDGSASEVFDVQINTGEVHGQDGQLISIYSNPYAPVSFAWRIDTATGERLNDVVLPIESDQAGYDGQFVLVDGWIYYAVSDGNLSNKYRNEGTRFMRARQDGSQWEEWFLPESPLRVSMWTIWQDRLYYALVNANNGKARLRSVGLDGTGDTLVFEEPLMLEFAHDGWAYGSALELDSEYRTYFGADKPTMRVSLSTGEVQRVGDFHPRALHPAGPYMILADVDDETWTHPLLMNPDFSGTQPLPQN